MIVLISLLIWLIVVGLVWWLVRMLPLPYPVAQIVQIVLIIILILAILSLFGLGPVNLPLVRLQ